MLVLELENSISGFIISSAFGLSISSWIDGHFLRR